MVVGPLESSTTTFDPLRWTRPEREPERAEPARERTPINPVIEDVFRAGGAALSMLFPQLGAVQKATGIDLDPLHWARALSGANGINGANGGSGTQPGRDLGPWDRYANMVREAGGEVNPNGQPTVLGIRNIDGASTEYGDKLVVLTPDHQVKIFHGSTHPGQSSSTDATDADGDGVGDVGMLRPGNYAVTPNGDHSGAPSHHVVTLNGGADPVNGFRDTNHDGEYSSRERRASRERGDKVTEILFHTGTSSGPSSIGCMNLPPETIARFDRAVGGQNGDGFNFTLIEP